MTDHPFTTRYFDRTCLPALSEFVSTLARTRWPAPSYLLTSDLAWQLPGSAPKENLRLWFDQHGIAAYGWFQPTATLMFDVRADIGYNHPLLDDLLAWAKERRHSFAPGHPFYLDVHDMDEWADHLQHPRPNTDTRLTLVASAFDHDSDRARWLAARGFTAIDHRGVYFRRSFDTPIPASRLPHGMTVRHVAVADFEERVAVHRDAWWPSSGFDMARYLSVRGIGIFDPELDLVLVADDGTFASYCIAWVDPDTGVGSFEPLGTRPAWRGQGVSKEVIYEGFRRQQAKGMHSAKLGTAGFNHPAQALYRSCGFEDAGVERTFVKVLN